jgi:FkbM family methyltransferase
LKLKFLYRRLTRSLTPKWRVSNLLSPFLPEIGCVDVGASYYPHMNWLVMLRSPQTQWLAVEPNEANLGYVSGWNWPARIRVCATGLSEFGGPQTLHVTNIDSGSSLLPPVIAESMKHRIDNPEYFFPVTERVIETLTLESAVSVFGEELPLFVKLDTQGSELSILHGASDLLGLGRIVGIEMESTLQAQPIMQGAGKFWQACAFLEEQGFELLHIQPIHAPPRHATGDQLRFLNECDAVFALRRDVAAHKPARYRSALLAFYATYGFYDEARLLLRQDEEVRDLLRSRGCDVERLSSLLDRLA